MPLYLISYDLAKEKDGHDYGPLLEALRDLEAVRTQWSVWYLDTGSTATQVYNYFAQFMDENDRLMVVEVRVKPVWGKGFQGTRDIVARYFP